MDKIIEFKNKLLSYKYFEEIYICFIALVAYIGWCTNSIVGISLLIALGVIFLLLTNELMFLVPNTIYMLFCINKGFKNNEVPIPLLVSAVIFIAILIIYLIRNKIKLKNCRLGLGLLGLAISNIIPIIWSNNIKEENSVFYFFFFTNLLYFITYFVFVTGVKKASTNILIKSMIGLGLLMTLECVYKVIELHDTVDNILSLWYNVGWGLCNEAGIMICVSMPFAFYCLGKSKNIKDIIIYHSIILVMLVGILLTTSRGGFIFGSLEYISLYISLLWYADNKKEFRKFSKIYGIILLVGTLICIIPIIHLVKAIIENIFYNGLDDNYRYDLWNMAMTNWIMNPRNIIFGPGFTCVIDTTITNEGIQIAPLVFHSTIFETLAIGGLFGMAFLILHMIHKYRIIYVLGDKLFFVCSLIGFIVVDIYGLIDNTYHMYYFMIPLTIVLAVLDNIYIKKAESIE